MPKVYKAKEIVKMLKKLWFVVVSQKWSHRKMKHPQKGNIAIVPIHGKDVPYGTFVSILEQAGISKDQAVGILGK